jgi:hypothetical protein
MVIPCGNVSIDSDIGPVNIVPVDPTVNITYGARFRQKFGEKFTLGDSISSPACSLQTSMRVTYVMALGYSLLLPVGTVNSVQTLQILCVD